MLMFSVNSGIKAGCSLDGNSLDIFVPGVGSLNIDLQEKQKENRRTINISLDRNYERLAEGVGSWYVANIIIPGVDYELVDTGEVDENGIPIMEKTALPLDTSKVELHLWGLPESLSEIVQEQEGEGE